MLIRISGGSGGIVEYLARGKKSGRDYDRDELDQRIALSGSLPQLESVLNSFDTEQQYQKYLHITLSFKEPHISESDLLAIDKQFHDFIFSACVDGEFHYYSEAHLPRLKALPDKRGNEYERFPHIHVIIPEYNLITGERDNPVFRINNITKYIDAFQEKINTDFKFASPKDNLRDIQTGRESIIDRYQIHADMPVKEIKNRIYDFIQAQPQITSVEELAAVIRALGVSATVRDSKSFGGKYINFAFDDSGKRKAINLKDPVFLDAYLSTRDAESAKAFLGDKAPEKLLVDWHGWAALEARFVGVAAPKIRQAYYALDDTGKQEWLNVRWQAHQKTIADLTPEPEPLTAEIPSIFAEPAIALREFDDIPHLDDLPHLDDIRHLDEIPHIDDYLDFEIEGYAKPARERKQQRAGAGDGTAISAGSTEYTVHELRSSSGHGSQRQGELATLTDLLQTDQFNGLERNQETEYTDVYLVSDQRRAVRSGSTDAVIARSESASWTDKINHIDGRVLLDYLSYHYHLNTREISVERNKDGYDRMVVTMPSVAASKSATRRLSAADMLTKYMHLSWPEAKRVLDSVLEQQDRGGYRQQAMTSKAMWQRFQNYEAQLPGLATVHHEYRQRRNAIKARWRWEYDHSQTAAQNAVKRRLYQQQRKAEYQQAKSDWQEAQVYYRMRPHERYLKYLQEEANAGNNMALGELQRIYPTEDDKRSYNALTIELRNPRQALPAFKPFDLGYQVKVQKNGMIEYRDEQAQTVILDCYQSIQVKVRTEDVIAQALEIAKARYGVNGFEIRNAKQSDLAAIQAAANRTGVDITLIASQPAKSSVNAKQQNLTSQERQ